MCRLKRLQLCLDKKGLHEQDKQEGELCVLFMSDHTPSLEVLVLEVQCNLRMRIDPTPRLVSLIVIATGTLQVRVYELEPLLALLRPPPAPEASTLQHMYLQSGAALLPKYRADMEASGTTQSWAGIRLLQNVKKEEHGWTARMPGSFQPGDVHACCCGACPECLARSGVPILFAWTRDGFDEYVMPSCNAAVS